MSVTIEVRSDERGARAEVLVEAEGDTLSDALIALSERLEGDI